MLMKPKSLFDLSLEASCSLEDAEYYEDLPFKLKEVILYKLTNYSALNRDHLRVLTHGNLKKLDLRKCYLTDSDLDFMKDLNELNYFYLPEPPVVTATAFSEQALMEVFENKSNLECVGLSGLLGVTNRVIRVLVQKSQQLRILILSSTSISDDALFHMKNLQDLAELNISHTNVTDSGIEEFVSGDAIKSLMFIRLNGCRNLSDASLELLLVPYYQLIVFDTDLSPKMTVEQLIKFRRNFV